MTINNDFRENWLKILNYNDNIEIWQKTSKEYKQKIRVPLTPFEINGSIIYHLFENLYPKFVNDQQNILDILISDDGKKLLGIYLYETKKAGIHGQYRKLPADIIIFQEKDLEDIEVLYSKLQMILLEKLDIRISTLRIFSKKVIDLINKHYENLKEITHYEFLYRIMEFIQVLFEKDLFKIHPVPNGYKFLKNTINLLNGIKLTQIFKLLYEILPEFNISIIFDSKEFDLIIKLQKQASKGRIDIRTPEELSIDLENTNIKEYMTTVYNKLDSANVYYLKLNHIVSLLSDLFEQDIPPVKDKVLLLFQKALYGYRSFEDNWHMVPRPKVYNNLIRFLLRLFGINLNLKKISHWAIPEILSTTFESFFGLNTKVLVILTDVKRFKLDIKKIDYLKAAYNSAILLEFENTNLIRISQINKDEILSDKENNSLELIRERISDKVGYVSSVINIDKALLTKIIDNFIFKLSKFNPFAKLKAFKMLKKEYYFNMYPKLPPYKLLKDKGLISFFKIFLPILIDKHEF